MLLMLIVFVAGIGRTENRAAWLYHCGCAPPLSHTGHLDVDGGRSCPSLPETDHRIQTSHNLSTPLHFCPQLGLALHYT